MWYKIEELEDKYDISKFSIYALITQKPELRQYIKALEGVLQINDEGIELLLKHVKKDKKNNKSVKNKELAISKDIINKELFTVTGKEKSIIPEAAEVELSVKAKKEEDVKKVPVAKAEKEEDIKKAPAISLEEEFFTHTSLAREEDFFGKTVDKDTLLSPIEAIVEEVVPEVDSVGKISILENNKNNKDNNISAYIKALKEKMIIQNKQVRAINEFLEVSKKILLQDEKIIHILEKIDFQ